MEGARVVHERKSKWQLVYARETKWRPRAREENYRTLYTNARFIPYLRTVIVVFVLHKKIRATWSKANNHPNPSQDWVGLQLGPDCLLKLVRTTFK